MWASRAVASSAASAQHLPAEAIGPPTHHITCAPQRAGSWVPNNRDRAEADDNWLEVEFATPVYSVDSLEIWEHAEPADASGFVTAVDVRACKLPAHGILHSIVGSATSLSAADPCAEHGSVWIRGVWKPNDTTPCGEVLTLTAADALRQSGMRLGAHLIAAVRIHTRVRRAAGRYPASDRLPGSLSPGGSPRSSPTSWEHIDAVRLTGSACGPGGTTIKSAADPAVAECRDGGPWVCVEDGCPRAPPHTNADTGKASCEDLAHHCPSAIEELWRPHNIDETLAPELVGRHVIDVCPKSCGVCDPRPLPPSPPVPPPGLPPAFPPWRPTWGIAGMSGFSLLGVAFAMMVGCAALTLSRRQRRRIVLRARRVAPLAPARPPTLMTRTSQQDGEERITLTLHKPDAASRLGIVFAPQAACEPNVYGLTPGSIAERTGALRVGDTLVSINGCVPTGGAHAVEMLSHAEGVVVLELKRPSAVAAVAANAAANAALAAATRRRRRRRRRRAGADGEVLGGAGRAGGGVVDGDHGEFGAHLVAGGAGAGIPNRSRRAGPYSGIPRRARGGAAVDAADAAAGGGGDECGDGGGRL